jgi:hypothetical protein
MGKNDWPVMLFGLAGDLLFWMVGAVFVPGWWRFFNPAAEKSSDC